MPKAFYFLLLIFSFFQATTAFAMEGELPSETTLSFDVEDDESKLRRAWILLEDEHAFTPRRSFGIEKPVALYAPALPRIASIGFSPVPIPTLPSNFLFVVPIRC